MKLVVIKENSLLRVGIIKVLEEHFLDHDIFTCGVSDYQEVINNQNNADLIIIDIDIDLNILALVDFYKKQNKKIIVWASNVVTPNLTDLIKLELDGYFFGEMEKEELINATLSVINGERYIHQSLAVELLKYHSKFNNINKPAGTLSNREWEILELLTKGLSNNQMASYMFISDKTVKNHLSNLFKKLDVPNRTNAVLKALENKWFVV